MDAFTWLVIVALGVCVLMHLFGHGHSHGGHKREDTDSRPGHRRAVQDDGSADHAEPPVGSGRAHRRGGCH